MNQVEQAFERFQSDRASRDNGHEQLADDPSPFLIAPTEGDAAPDPILDLAPMPAGVLITEHHTMNPPVIHGIIREGETANIIAPPKSHKTYTAIGMSLCVATGRRWLGTFDVEPGPVLYVDCELHPPTFAKRLEAVAGAMGIYSAEYAEALEVLCLRGRLKNIVELGAFFSKLTRHRYKLIVLDALYRLMPPDFDENSNADMAKIYNLIDRYAADAGCAFVVIHHASKGGQSEKSVTDVGAGAGAQSRAADAHIVLRQHEEDNAVVLEAVNRSFPPLAPLCLRWRYPVWETAGDLDPANLRKGNRKTKPEDARTAEPQWTPATFAKTFGTETPTEKRAIVSRAARSVGSRVKADDLCREAIADGLLHEWKSKARQEPVKLATVPQPKSGRKAKRVAELLPA